MQHSYDDVICWCDICEEYRRKHYRKEYNDPRKNENEAMTWLLIGLVLVSIILIGGYIDAEYYKITDIL